MVEAVPIVLQCPADGADEATRSTKPLLSSLPAACIWRAAHRMVPDPVRSLLNQPFSIGPPESAMAGISTVAAAMICAGVVLSQPVVSTTASIG
jgi:hypothetical protein